MASAYLSTSTKKTTSSSSSSRTTPSIRKTPNHFIMGLPLVLFSLLSTWVVSNALSGKLKEMETAKGIQSQSLRQAALAKEHDDMMEIIQKSVSSDASFDNTKRIKRPHEILEERRLERERKNVWYRRWYRAIVMKRKNEE